VRIGHNTAGWSAYCQSMHLHSWVLHLQSAIQTSKYYFTVSPAKGRFELPFPRTCIGHAFRRDLLLRTAPDSQQSRDLNYIYTAHRGPGAHMAAFMMHAYAGTTFCCEQSGIFPRGQQHTQYLQLLSYRTAHSASPKLSASSVDLYTLHTYG
jgi:hypothetical protein